MVFYSSYKNLKDFLQMHHYKKFLAFIFKFFHDKTPKKAVLIINKK
jgi:hypothetical protein